LSATGFSIGIEDDQAGGTALALAAFMFSDFAFIFSDFIMSIVPEASPKMSVAQ
jgi:hypothetical protein